jgi:predicted nucleic acid-binding protein
MVSTPALFDTVILIDYLVGISQARIECDRYADRAISIITWMEVLAGATPTNEADARTLPLNFQLALLTQEVAERALIIRRRSRIKLPDAIIKATAESEGRVLITRNTRDSPASTPGIHIPIRFT